MLTAVSSSAPRTDARTRAAWQTQVAAALQLSSKTILRAIAQGRLEARKAGKLYLIAQDAVQRYWESLPLATVAPKTVGRPKKTPRAEPVAP